MKNQKDNKSNYANDSDDSPKFLLKKPSFFNRNKKNNKPNQKNDNQKKRRQPEQPAVPSVSFISPVSPAPVAPAPVVSKTPAPQNTSVKENPNKTVKEPAKPVQNQNTAPPVKILHVPKKSKNNNANNKNRNQSGDRANAGNINKPEKFEKPNKFQANNNPSAVKKAPDINSNKNVYIKPEPETDLKYGQPEEEEDIFEAINLNPKTPEAEDTSEKIEIVGIRFKPVGKIYFFAPNGTDYSANDKIIVETSRGLELGYIVIPNKNISVNKVIQPLKPVIRKATEDDVQKAERNKKAAKETIKIANDRIKFHNLHNMKMKLIEAEYTFDNSKLIYYFTADGRVDFRELVKDLAAIFKTRIEMRQIGIRDQTKILGGLSICGRPFCCNSFLQDFTQVTIKMAKEQNMSINSAKISGACGRLMCCLKYEHEAYDYLSKDTPKVNSIVEASTGETGVVIESNILTGICKVKISNKNNPDAEAAIKPFPKKSLKIIGFLKNEQKNPRGGVEDASVTEDIEDLKALESDM